MATTTTSPVLILFDTTTGNSEMVADELAEMLDRRDISYRFSDADEIDFEILYEVNTLLLVTSTDGDGEPPWSAEELYNYLDDKRKADLHHLNYSVLALGDSDFENFCQAGKDFDRTLSELGAHRIAQRVDCDEHFWPDAEGWIEAVCQTIEQGIRKPVPSV